MWPSIDTENRRNRLLLYDVPVLAYAGLIFWLSSRPYTPRQKEWLELLPDYLLHGCEYALLAFLLLRQLRLSGRIRGLYAPALLAWIIVVAYAASDEWHQSFVPGRNPDVRDWLADSAGGLVVAAAGVYLQKKEKLTLPGNLL